MNGVRIQVLVEDGLVGSPVAVLAEAVARGAGGVVESGVLEPDREELAALPVGTASAPVLILVVSPRKALDWRETIATGGLEALANRIAILCTDGTVAPHTRPLPAAAHAYFVGMADGPTTSAANAAFVEELLSALGKAEEQLLIAPATFAPQDTLTAETREPYEVMCAKKSVHIAAEGHGQIEFEWNIRVTGRGFSGTTHYFGLDSSVASDQSIPSLDRLLRTKFDIHSSEPSFRCGILSSSEPDIVMTPIELFAQSSRRYCAVKLTLAPEPPPGALVRFAWSWVHPALFSSKGPDKSTFKCLKDFQKVELSCFFDHPSATEHVAFDPLGVPTLAIVNPTGLLQARFAGTAEPRLVGTRFRWVSYGASAGSRFEVRWTRE